MFHSPTVVVIISPNRDLHLEIETVLSTASLASTVWSIADYPELRDLERLRDVEGACILFLDFRDMVRARTVAAELDRNYPMVGVIGVHKVEEKHDALMLMQLGIREVISPIVDCAQLASAFGRTLRKVKGSEEAAQNIYAFLPAKPGAGATTIAINVAWAVAKEIAPERVLLLDFDLRLGITSFLMKLDGRHSVQDALMESARLDESVWESLICRRDNLDILGSSPADLPLDLPTEAYNSVFECARRIYRVICVDTAGALEAHEVAALQRAKEIFLIGTADIAGLHMARRKSTALQKLGLADNVSVIMNRAERRATLPIAEIERLLEFPVRFTVPSDDKAIMRSVDSGAPVESNSSIGAQISAIARRIAGNTMPGSSAPRKHRFVDYFSISPVRDRVQWKR